MAREHLQGLEVMSIHIVYRVHVKKRRCLLVRDPGRKSNIQVWVSQLEMTFCPCLLGDVEADQKKRKKKGEGWGREWTKKFGEKKMRGSLRCSPEARSADNQVQPKHLVEREQVTFRMVADAVLCY